MIEAISSFRISFQNGTEAHYAEVDLRLCPFVDSIVVFNCPLDQIRGWDKAAKTGVEEAFLVLRERGFVTNCYSVSIERFVGLASDTDDEDVRATVFAAVVQAVSGMKAKPGLIRDFADHRWKVVW